MSGLYTTAVLILAALLLYRFREVWLGALARFDARNRARLEEQQRDKADPLAHFKHAMRLADEQLEEIREIVEPDARTGNPVTRYLFSAEKFATRDDAEAARAAAVADTARKFYRELPAALAARREDDRLH